MRVLLIGMMGSGKTTVGELLADRLGVPYLDSDAEVEAATGRTVREIWEEEGEAAFRAQETRALERSLSGDDSRVVSVAGGAVVDPGNRGLVKQAGTVVWLRAYPATLADRVSDGDHRPLLADDPEGTLKRLLEERRHLYEDAADLIVDVDHLTPTQVVDRIMELWSDKHPETGG